MFQTDGQAETSHTQSSPAPPPPCPVPSFPRARQGFSPTLDPLAVPGGRVATPLLLQLTVQFVSSSAFLFCTETEFPFADSDAGAHLCSPHASRLVEPGWSGRAAAGPLSPERLSWPPWSFVCDRPTNRQVQGESQAG